MIIDHPLLGPRDASEFIYLGDASLLNRPKWDEEKSEDKKEESSDNKEENKESK